LEKDFKAEEWGKLTTPERAALCRQLASDGQRLSSTANGQFKSLYADLATQWTRLADAIEHSIAKS